MARTQAEAQDAGGISSLIVDTDVVSFLFKSHSLAEPYLRLLQNHEWLISFMTEAELEQWVLGAHWGANRIASMRVFLRKFGRIGSSRDLILKWAEVRVAARRSGRPIEASDAWIAATALLYDAPLVTHNRSDYLGVPGLKLISHSHSGE